MPMCTLTTMWQMLWHFFSKGGRVEYAIDGLVRALTTGDFDEAYLGEYADDDGGYGELPTHPLDECLDLVRYHLLGPKGLVPEGPFYAD